jgi:protein lysine acetyltransferase
VLLRRGDLAEHFLLLTCGRARVAFGELGAQKVSDVAEGSILGEMALLRGTRRSATVTAVTQTRGLKGGRAAFTRLLALPGVLEKVVTTARRRLAADLVPVPVTLRDGTAAGLRPICPGEQYELVRGERLFSAQTRYKRFFAAVHITAPLARYLAEVDYVDHFAWVAVDSSDVPMGGATYVRSVSDRALADISFLIEDEFQGRGLGTLLMGAVAIAARRNGIARFCADVLAENVPMRAVLARRRHVAACAGRCRARLCRGPRPGPVRHHARHGGGTGRRRGRDEDPAVVLARLRPAKCGKLCRGERDVACRTAGRVTAGSGAVGPTMNLCLTPRSPPPRRSRRCTGSAGWCSAWRSAL